MVDVAGIVLLAGVLVFAAHFFEWLFNFTRIPNVLLLILVGLLLGPVLGLLSPNFFGQAGALFAILVLTIILFEGGTQLRLDFIIKAWRSATLLSLVSFILSMTVVAFLVWYFTDLPLVLSFVLGTIVGGTSSAVIIPLVERLAVQPQTRTMLYLESALTDVLSVVLTIALLTAFEAGSFNFTLVSLDIVYSFLGAASVGVLGGFMWSILLHRVRHMRNSIFSTPAFVFILFGIAELLNVSGPIAALAFGITIGNIAFFTLYLERRHLFLRSLLQPVTLSDQEKSFFSEVVFVLETFFFVYVGLFISFDNRLAFTIALLLIVFLFVLRIPITRLAAPSVTPLPDRVLIATLVPKGLAAAVLAVLVVERGIAGGVFIQEVVYAVILLSIVGTSALLFLVSKTGVGRMYGWLLRRGDEALAPPISPATSSSHIPR